MKFAIGVVVCLQLCAQLLANPVPEEQSDPVPEQQKFCTDAPLIITVDNEMTLYIDGVQVTSGIPNANHWPISDTVQLKASQSIIAVKGVDLGVVAGILASGADARSDKSWKCTNKFHEGWYKLDYNDKDWPKAIEVGHQGDYPWVPVTTISNDAKWIWTLKNKCSATSDRTVYCRKKRGCRPKEVVPPTTTTPKPVVLPTTTTPKPVVLPTTTTPKPVVLPTTTTPKPSIITGPTCITKCKGLANGDYQHCKRCDVYITCSNGLLYDNRPCAPSNPALVWDDKKKRCEWESTTCKPV